MKKGWTSTHTSYYGGYDGNYKVYEITSPAGNTYKVHNNNNRYPHFYMETNNLGHYDKSIGRTFNEAMQTLYQLEEEQAFHAINKDYKKQLYKHSYSLKDGYSVQKIDMSSIFFQQVQLLHPYTEGVRTYSIYTNESQKEFVKAKKILKDLFEKEYKSYLEKQLAQAKESLERFENMIDDMMTNDSFKLEEYEDNDEMER